MKETENKSAEIDRIEKALKYIKTHKIQMACLFGVLFGYAGARLASLIAGGDGHIAVITGVSVGLYVAIVGPAAIIHTLEVNLNRLKTGKFAWTDHSQSMQNLLRTMLINLGIMIAVFTCLSLIFDYQWIIKSLPWHP